MYIKLDNLQKTFQNFKACDNVSFEIEKGKLISFLGPSGSGKTTILRMIAGLETPDSGDIYIGGKRMNDVEPSKRGIGFVFQNYALFRYMTVFDNIAFGLKIQKKSKKEIKDRVNELIELVGLKGLEKRYPNQLSGGQKQRVAFARAIAPNPQLLLLDEPFAAIDAKVRQELRSWLRKTIETLGITSIFVTHDQDEAIEVSDEIVIINHGRVEAKNSPVEIYKHPANPFVAKFIGQTIGVEYPNRIKGFEKLDDDSKAVIRPEFIKISVANEKMQYEKAAEDGIVEETFFRGSYTEVKVNVKGMTFVANRLLEDAPVKRGDKVKVLIYRLHVFQGEETLMFENADINADNLFYI